MIPILRLVLLLSHSPSFSRISLTLSVFWGSILSLSLRRDILSCPSLHSPAMTLHSPVILRTRTSNERQSQTKGVQREYKVCLFVSRCPSFTVCVMVRVSTCLSSTCHHHHSARLSQDIHVARELLRNSAHPCLFGLLHHIVSPSTCETTSQQELRDSTFSRPSMYLPL